MGGFREIRISDEGHVGSTESVSVQASTHLWLVWGEIAIEHCHASRRAREQALALETATGGSELSIALSREMKASMVAVPAAAHGIDAFYGATKPYISVPAETNNRWKNNETARQKVILETFKLGFTLGKIAGRWSTEFDWLFTSRNAVLHYKETFKDLKSHPAGTKTAPENVTYLLESTDRAVRLFLEVLAICQAGPKPRLGELVRYVAPHGDAVQRLQAQYGE